MHETSQIMYRIIIMIDKTRSLQSTAISINSFQSHDNWVTRTPFKSKHKTEIGSLCTYSSGVFKVRFEIALNISFSISKNLIFFDVHLNILNHYVNEDVRISVISTIKTKRERNK